jgi:hypothetical protein
MLKQAIKAVLPASLQAEIRKFLQQRRHAAAQAQVARVGAGIGAAFPSSRRDPGMMA